MHPRPNSGSISRRRLLAFGGMASAALLVACQAPAPTATPVPAKPAAPAPTTAPAAPVAKPTSAPATAPTTVPVAAAKPGSQATAPAAAAAKPTTAPAAAAPKTTAPYKLRFADTTTGGPVKEWLTKVLFKTYQERFPNVTIDHTGMQLDQYRTALPLAVKSGQEADVFLGPFWLPLYGPVKEGWFHEIGPLLGAEFTKAMPPELFEEGRTVFHGKTYALPNVAFQPGGFLFYNKNLMKKAGLDPEKPPTTWTELREQARKLNDAGKGEFFGIVEGGKQLNRFMDDVGYLASKAGGHSAQPSFQRWNYQTGNIEYDSPEFVAAVDLLLGMKSDNSYMPGFMNMTGTDGVGHFREQRAGFFIYGPWNIQEFLQNKEIDFGVTALPSPDSGQKGKLQYPRQAVTVSFASAKSKAPDLAVEFMKLRWGPEMMADYVKAGLGSSAISYVNKPEYFPSKQAAECSGLVFSERQVPPEVIRRNPEQAAVLEEYKEPSPDIQRLLQGVMSGQVTDYKTAAKDLSAKMNAEMDRAHKVAQDKGAKVKRSDWAFPNWEPMKDYDDDAYKGLPS